MSQLSGLSVAKASLYGMPHLGCFYEGEGVNSHKREADALCTICGKPADNAHHEPPKGTAPLFVLKTGWGAFLLKPALIALCGSGTTGCHGDRHNGRYEFRWEWKSAEYAEKWWSGWFLAHGYDPHDPRLYEFGHWEIKDKKTRRLLYRSGILMEG